MKQLIISNIDSNWPKIEIDYHKQIELFVDSFQGLNVNKKSYKIFYLREPEEVQHLDKIVMDNNVFDLILTTNKLVLDNCSNAKVMEFGTAWVFNYNFPEKKFQISHLLGHKRMTSGHILRKNIYIKQHKITNPIDFYVSHFCNKESNLFENKILFDKKEPLFDSQFHICIENCQQEYWFTEKLIDCFVTKTVPIYWGCPRISDYFNVNGMIVVNSINDIIDVCNSLTDKTYFDMMPYVEENYNLCQKFIKLQPRIQEKIIENLS